MENQSDSTGEADGDISLRILTAWNQRKDIRQISRETGLSVKEVSRILKQKQKAVVEKGVKKP